MFATDTKLKRQVATKILPPSLAADPDRLARFPREAEVLAALNHPNIAAVHGLERTADLTALPADPVGILADNFTNFVFVTSDGRGHAYSVSRILSDLHVVEGLKWARFDSNHEHHRQKRSGCSAAHDHCL